MRAFDGFLRNADPDVFGGLPGGSFAVIGEVEWYREQSVVQRVVLYSAVVYVVGIRTSFGLVRLVGLKQGKFFKQFYFSKLDFKIVYNTIVK